MTPSRVLAPALVAVVFVTTTASAQQVIHGCVKNNNGQVRIVSAGEACLPSEHAIQWQGTDSSISAAATPGPLRVVDQSGSTLGVLTGQGTAARQVGDVWIALPVAVNGFLLTDPSTFMAYYQTADCSGDAYLPLDANSLLRSGVVMPAATGQPAFSYAGKPEVERTTILAYGRYEGTVWACHGFTPGPWMPTFGKAATLDLGTFKGPFKVVQ